MFWRRHHCYYDCYHHHGRRSFRRGMIAMFVLAFAVLGLLDHPPGHHHHANAHHRQVSAASPSHQSRHHQPPHADRHRPRLQPKPPAARNRAQHSKPTSGQEHRPPERGITTATAGQDLTWTDFHGIQLPASASAGPRHTRGGLAWGFADTPRGALLAAVNIAVRTAAEWGPAIFRPTITRQVTGPNAHALLAADISAYAQARRTPAQPTAVEEAYRFQSYDPAAAAIDLVTSGPGISGDPVLAVSRLQVVWRHGDWRLVAPPAGDWAGASAQISSLAGFTIFPNAR